MHNMPRFPWPLQAMDHPLSREMKGGMAAAIVEHHRQKRRAMRRFLFSTASHLAYRVKGRLDGRVNVTLLGDVAKSEPWWWHVARREDGGMS